MHTQQKIAFTGIGLLGAAVLLAGCGGSSFSKQSFGTYPNTLPYAYGLEPVAAGGAGNAAGNQAFIEGSGLQSADGTKAFITGASAFVATTAVGATLPPNVDPNGTGSLPLGFSTGGSYVDAANQVGLAITPVFSVSPGASVVFRAALANGTSDAGVAPGITGATLTSTDPQLASIPGLTAGLPMTLNAIGGAFSSATYVTGTNQTPAPFTIPAATTTGLHTATVTVSDDAGRVTATTFIFPIVAASNVALFAQNVIADGQTVPAGKTATGTPITGGDTVTIDGAKGVGTYPAGYTPTIADPQGTVVFFVAPGTHTLVDTNVVPTTAKAAAVTTVTTQTIVIPASAAGTTIIQ